MYSLSYKNKGDEMIKLKAHKTLLYGYFTVPQNDIFKIQKFKILP